MQMNALELRKGHLVEHEGRVCTVNDWSIMRNDRRQYVYITLKDLLTGRIQELKLAGDAKFQFLESERITLTHSYSDGPEEVFYTEDGAEFRCSAEAAKDALIWGSDSYIGFLVQGKLISISPPASVIVEVADTAPPMRGAGSTGLKDAMLVNGIKVRVANLVANGEKVRIDPVTLEFRERIAN
jgi:translation elongation factor P/translation initiation factor 5A